MTEPDLNLLRLFDMLYEERSVTRAANRLNLTQSAVSHALARLRATFGDRLFTRGPGGLLPTARAVELAPRVHDILVSIRDAFAPPAFDAAVSDRGFTIAAGRYFGRLIFPRLAAMARATAPNVRLRLINVDQALADDLDEGLVDLAAGAFDDIPARFDTSLLIEDEMVWVAAIDHPRAAALADPASLLAERRIDIFVDHAPRPLRANRPRDMLPRRLSSEQMVLAMAVEPREPYGAQVYDAETALAVVAATDLIAVAPRRMVSELADLTGLRILPSPDTMQSVRLFMLWHRRFADDPGARWLRALVKAASDPA